MTDKTQDNTATFSMATPCACGNDGDPDPACLHCGGTGWCEFNPASVADLNVVSATSTVMPFEHMFNTVAMHHHKMMVDRGFHDDVDDAHLFVGMQVCARIRGQTTWLEDVRNGLMPDQYRKTYDFGPEVMRSKDTKTTLLKIALVATELTELVEEVIKAEPDGDACAEEAADVILRIMDLAVAKGWDLGEAIGRKFSKNAKRGHKHGKAF